LNSTDNISEIESCNNNVRLKNVTFQLGMSISKSEALLTKVVRFQLGMSISKSEALLTKVVRFQLGMSISKSEALLEKVWTTCTIRRRKQKE
jgi:hypothetical protein